MNQFDELEDILLDLNIEASKTVINKLNTGIVVRFNDIGGKIKVHTDSDKNFVPYMSTFAPIKLWEDYKKLNDEI